MKQDSPKYYIVEDICVACGQPTIPGNQICDRCMQIAQTPIPPRETKPKPKSFSFFRLFKGGKK